MARTLIILKPDAMERRLAGEIISRFDKRGIEIAAAQIVHIKPELAKKHYAEHVGKDFYPELEAFIGRSPCLVMILEGSEEIVQVARDMIGPTNPKDAPSGTIRGDLGLEVSENLIHGSDSPKAAEREISLFFG